MPPLTELYEGRLAGGHLHDGAAQGPDVGRGAVPTLPFVYHLHKKRFIIKRQTQRSKFISRLVPSRPS